MGMETRSFAPATEPAARVWLEKYLPERNIYFSVNTLTRAQEKKAETRDIKSMDWLHVDLDPDKTKDFQEERARILALLEKLPTGVPEPSVIIDSGGGVQLFWKLEEPVQINGNVELAEDAKRYNQQLEALLGGDATHNIDRIMRLPGSVNYPNARKRAAGRATAATRLLRFSDLVYKLSDFIQAPQVQTKAFGGGFSAPTSLVEIRSGNTKRLEQVDDLDAWNVPYRVKMIVMEGRNAEEGPKDRDDSRSSWLFDAVCGLVRAGVPDEVVYSVITDPDFKISESVLDKGSNAHKYAVKQIEDARLKAINPQLLELNQRHAVIANLGGKCRVIEEVADTNLDNRTRLTRQSFEDFRNRYMNRHVELGVDDKNRPIRKPLGKWWLEHEHRRQYNSIIFAPGREVSGHYNLWRGFSYQARPGDCSDFLEHVRLNICRGDEAVYEYLVGWMARAVQEPDSAGQVALVLRGPQGTGKGFFARTFGSLWGRHFLHVSNSKHLVGSFNAHLRDCVVIFADEAFYAGDKMHESVLKTLITEDTIMVEGKGLDAEVSPNFTHVIMASNSHWVIPAGAGERRYCVIDVGEDKMQDAAYFKEVTKKMESGGYEALLHFLMTYDLSRYEVRNFPRTKALQDQKVFSLSVEEEWWFAKLCDSQTIPGQEGWLREVSKQDLFDDYIEYAKKLSINRRLSQTALGKFLHRVTPSGYPRSYQKLTTVSIPTDNGYSNRTRMRVYYYELPNLDACREVWDAQYGNMVDWDENQETMAV